MSEGMLLAGRYELGRTLGAGGMARVVEANDRVLHRRVAIKLAERDLAQTADPSLTARFVAEARTTATLTHRNLVAVYDAGDSDGYLYLVTELVDGTNLAERIVDEGPLPIEEATRIAGELLSALDAAHRAGIVHRDVKPSNVLLDRAGTVKLADFGIAKRLDDLEAALTKAGEIVGTPRYVSPEQAVGDPSTPSTDLYATGVVLYEMLTGDPPFEGGTPMATLIAHRDQPVPDVRERRPDTPVPLAAAIATAMAKRPEERFPSAQAMRTAVVGDPRGAATPGAAGAAAAAMAPTVAAAAATPTPTSAYPPINPVGPVAATSAPGSGRRTSPWWWIVAVALLALGGGAIAMAASDGDDGTTLVDTTTTEQPQRGGGGGTPRSQSTPETEPPPETDAPTTTSPPTATTLPPATTTTTPPTTAPAVVTPDLPVDLGALYEAIAADPSLFGERTDELLDRLDKVLSEEDAEKRAEEARKASEELGKWLEDDEVDADLAAQVVESLQPFLAADDGGGPPDDPGNSESNGNGGEGNGNGNDEDDDEDD